MVVFFLNLAFSVLNTFAQTDPKPDSTTRDTMNVVFQHSSLEGTFKKEIFRKNIIKVNLSAFALYNNSISYERSLSRKTTFVAGYRYMPHTTVTSAYLVQKAIDRSGDEELEDDLNSILIGNNTFTGEIRFYTGKYPGARGFYLSLYGQYINVTASIPSEYETETRVYPLTYDGTLKGFAGGAMIGAQWLIAKRVTFDWYILGGHYGRLKVDMPAVMDISTMTASEKIGLKEDIEAINHEYRVKTDVEATVTDQGVSVKGTLPYLGIRGLGFNLGIAF